VSLKAFHVIFITASILLALGFVIWELKQYFSSDSSILNLLLALGSFAGCVGLIVYERYFLKKLKNVSYL